VRDRRQGEEKLQLVLTNVSAISKFVFCGFLAIIDYRLNSKNSIKILTTGTLNINNNAYANKTFKANLINLLAYQICVRNVCQKNHSGFMYALAIFSSIKL
jgi:hypothetical protein